MSPATSPVPGRGHYRGRARDRSSRLRGGTGCGRGARGGTSHGHGARGGTCRGRGAWGKTGAGGHSGPEEWKWSSTQNSSNTSTAMTYSGGVPGPTGLALGVTNPVDCFHLFLSSDIYDELLVQTNLYADQQRAAKNDTSRWTPISKEELMAFIGINIAMGIVYLF